MYMCVSVDVCGMCMCMCVSVDVCGYVCTCGCECAHVVCVFMCTWCMENYQREANKLLIVVIDTSLEFT